MSGGYTGKPLYQKLGIREGYRLAFINTPVYYRALLPILPDGAVLISDPGQKKDFIHMFVNKADELYHLLPSLKQQIVENGMIWISWPKQRSKFATDINEDLVRAAAISNGLVDVKVCSVNETWSALKLVIPVKNRITSIDPAR